MFLTSLVSSYLLKLQIQLLLINLHGQAFNKQKIIIGVYISVINTEIHLVLHCIPNGGAVIKCHLSLSGQVSITSCSR